MDLTTLRDEIDAIDKQLVDLFLKRMAIVEKVARYKIENNLPVFHPERERAVISRAKERSPQQMEKYVGEFFAAAMEVSRHMQNDLIGGSKK